MVAESKTTPWAPLKVRVLAPTLITVEASKLKESANSVKFKVSADRSAATMVPSRIFVLVTTPVPTMAFVSVRVLIELESKT